MSVPSSTARREVAADELDALQGVGVDDRMGALRGEGLDAVRHGVDAGGGRDDRRDRDGQRRVDDRDVGEHLDALGRDLVHRRRVGDQRPRPDLAAGAGGRRDLRERDACASARGSGRRCRAAASRSATSTATSLARSIALPPPKPITASASAALAAATAASRFGRSGSGFTSPKSAASVEPEDVEAGGVHLVGDDEGTAGRRSPRARRRGSRPGRRRSGRSRDAASRSGCCRVSIGRSSSGDGEPAGLLDLGVGVEAGGEQAAGVGLLRASRRSRGRCRSRRRGPSP